MPLPNSITADIYYKSGNYWLLNGAGQYVELGRADCRCLIAQRSAATGHNAKDKELRENLALIAQNQTIDYVLPNLPGYPIGLHLLNKTKILVPEALTIIQPQNGSAPISEGILMRMLGPDCRCRQAV
jgi:hypothetical protein